MEKELTPFQEALKRCDWDTNPESIRALVNRLMEIPRIKDRDEMLVNLCFVTGVAVAVLLDYATKLEDELRKDKV